MAKNLATKRGDIEKILTHENPAQIIIPLKKRRAP